MSSKLILPYGLWPSPLTAGLVSQPIRLDDAQWVPDGQTLIWIEGRSGGGALVAQTGCEAPREMTVNRAPRGGYSG